MIEKIREAFEAEQNEPPEKDANGDYTGFLMRLAFLNFKSGWKAALASSDSEKGQEPVAWAAFTVDGNIRIWTAKETEVNRLAAAVGQELQPLYTSPVVKDSLTVAHRSPAQDSKVPEEWGIKETDNGRVEVWPPEEMPISLPPEPESLEGRYLVMLCRSLLSTAPVPDKPQRPPLAKDHEGMRISASGILHRVGGHIKFGARQMCEHLEEMGRRYYAGEVSVVDEFLQLYCLDEGRPETPEASA
ncbi:hypothetical protein [Microbulbifer sp. HZ11]|uniref:hypothetical protein n=1 Tax=Microbulbifer sp. HZ11 TaxID=1453501 RepID=UPI0005BAA8C2|nr:hypothetical protein [Microbulbifer sp. HZ11]